MSGKKLQLKKKPVRVLDSVRIENVTGGLVGAAHGDAYYEPPPENPDPTLLTKYRCVGTNGSSGAGI